MIDLRENEPLAPYTAWRIGGPARYFVNVSSPEQQIEAVQWAELQQVPIFMLGGGSNLLMSDAGWNGLVIRNRATGFEIQEHGEQLTIHVQAGAPTAGTVRRLAAQGIAGLEWAEGLPGTIGGAIYGNAGCYGGETAKHLQSARLLMPDNQIVEWWAADFQFYYRTSQLKRLAANRPTTRIPYVLDAVLTAWRDDPVRIAGTMAEIAEGRKQRTPAGSSCGSVFKNPANTTAGRLIDAAGLKGFRMGAAQIAEKHANYILNLGGATASDILRVAEYAQTEVLKQFGIELELEVRVISSEDQSL